MPRPRKQLKDKKERVRSKFRMYNKLTVVPPCLRRTLVYAESFNYELSYLMANYATINTFRANGLYDPREAYGGHQPRMFDQYMALYVNAVVLGARVTVIFSCPDGGYYTGDCGVCVSSALPSSTDYDPLYLMEQSTSVFGVYGQGMPRMLKCSVDIADFTGVTSVTDNEKLQSSSFRDPIQEVFFWIWASQHSFAPRVEDPVTGLPITPQSKFHMSLKIEYDVLFQEPKNVAPS